MNRVEDGVWPLLRDDRDPWRAPWPDDDLGYDDHVVSPLVDTRPPAAYRTAALALQDWLDELDRGAPFDVAALRAHRQAAAIPPRLAWDRRPVVVAPEVVSPDAIVLEALDGVPDAGQRGTDEILGPWRLALHPDRDRRTLVHAVAHWAVSGPGRSPAQVWTRSHSAPPAPVRASVRAIWTAPLGVWRTHARGSAFELQDLLDIDPRRQPDAPVDLTAADRPIQDGDTLLARAVPTASGWTAWAPIRLPRTPSDAVLRALVEVGLTRLRLSDRRAMIEDVLRAEGRWFARRVLTAVW